MDWFITYKKIKKMRSTQRPRDFETFIFRTLFARPLSSGETDRVHREMSHAFQRFNISFPSVVVLNTMERGEKGERGTHV